MGRESGRVTPTRRDTQKTQHGIETARSPSRPPSRRGVETLRKPSTGLKLIFEVATEYLDVVETLRKPSTGLKPAGGAGLAYLARGRDTQKTQHGIETI